MTHQGQEGLLLGRQTPPVDQYAPQLLFPIPRGEARRQLGFSGVLPFTGADLWHAYELSWLDANGKPVSRVGRFAIPASSPNMVESKSFKLYLNSINNTRFASEAKARDTILDDVGRVVGATVTMQLHTVDDPALAGEKLSGTCIDNLDIVVPVEEPRAQLLEIDPGSGRVEESLYSHLLRSLCPVTGQPDWATLWLHYRGAALDHRALLRYIISYRSHREFHEQCVERMFRDLLQSAQPDVLHIQAFYTRRGGLDINPFRSTDGQAMPLPRINRQ